MKTLINYLEQLIEDQTEVTISLIIKNQLDTTLQPYTIDDYYIDNQELTIIFNSTELNINISSATITEDDPMIGGYIITTPYIEVSINPI